jgi:hypothetical protein
MKGEQIMTDREQKKKITLYLDIESIEFFKKFSLEELKSGSISEAIRFIAKDYEKLIKQNN